MLIKFIQLQPGQAFVFEGQPYVKSSPLMARNETTGQERFIPRSAFVESGAATAAPPEPRREPVSAEVRNAWSAFRHRLAELTTRLEEQLDEERAAELRRSLTQAAEEFERQLGLTRED